MAEIGAKLQRLARVAKVFTPGAPIEDVDLFAGRQELILDAVNATLQRGLHVVLYGERGVGKTSLASIISQVFTPGEELPDLNCVRVDCSSDSDFQSLWRAVFRDLGTDTRTEENHLLPSELTPEDVRHHLERMSGVTIIILDELDRLENDETLTLLADTIKTLSDHSVRSTLVLVGVADSVDELVGDHRSIERALVQVEMPRMDTEELGEIIDKGLARLGLTIDANAKARISSLSEGLPYYTHLLALHASQRALTDDRNEIGDSDVAAAINAAVQKARQTIKSAYQRATRSAHTKHLFREVLLACALAPKDDLGYFTAGGVRNPLSAIMKKRYEIPAFARHLKEFSEPARGPVLIKKGQERRYFYRFENALLQPYVILEGLTAGLITEDVVQSLQGETPRRLVIPDSPSGL